MACASLHTAERNLPMDRSPPTPETLARRVLVSGRVTGVGFRWHTLQQAEAYDGLCGHVRNRDARTVECLLQGEAWMVEEMIAWLRHGPSWAKVERIEITPLPLDPTLAEFHIAG